MNITRTRKLEEVPFRLFRSVLTSHPMHVRQCTPSVQSRLFPRINDLSTLFAHGQTDGKRWGGKRKGGRNQRERERWLTRFKEEGDCSTKCVIHVGGVINRTNQIVCL